MHTLKLLVTLLKINLQMSLAYRVDTWVNILLSLFWLGWELLSLTIIFSNTATLGGWGPGELVALLGVFRLVNALMAALIWPNTEKFNASVRDGSLDYTLLYPASSQFMVSFSRIILWRAWDLALGLILIGIGIGMSGGGAGDWANLVQFTLLAFSGTVILYSLWIVMIALTFWFIKFDNNVTILQAMLDTGRYPATVYPPWLRMIVTFIVPVAVATTVPLQALRGELSGLQVLLYLAIGAVAFWLSARLWRAGVKRYSGASA